MLFSMNAPQWLAGDMKRRRLLPSAGVRPVLRSEPESQSTPVPHPSKPSLPRGLHCISVPIQNGSTSIGICDSPFPLRSCCGCADSGTLPPPPPPSSPCPGPPPPRHADPRSNFPFALPSLPRDDASSSAGPGHKYTSSPTSCTSRTLPHYPPAACTGSSSSGRHHWAAASWSGSADLLLLLLLGCWWWWWFGAHVSGAKIREATRKGLDMYNMSEAGCVPSVGAMCLIPNGALVVVHKKGAAIRHDAVRDCFPTKIHRQELSDNKRHPQKR
ncbi:hypothetical protein GE09DRAFT_82100 [Coniochaeta sp. 2T2.1]|nr:hypothetical protein GE09DRAFT_82100 [Coniochaeta sp. 2T2.1]